MGGPVPGQSALSSGVFSGQPIQENENLQASLLVPFQTLVPAGTILVLLALSNDVFIARAQRTRVYLYSTMHTMDIPFYL